MMWLRAAAACLGSGRGRAPALRRAASATGAGAEGRAQPGERKTGEIEDMGVPMLVESDIRQVVPRAGVKSAVMDVERRVLGFDEVPGPRALKFLAAGRRYLSAFGTQITARILTLGVNLGSVQTWNATYRSLTYLFNEYGPVVRFIGPLGGDIILLNNPEHIQKVFSQEGEYPVRSTLDSLEKYRLRSRSYQYSGPFSIHGEEWNRQRSLLEDPFKSAVSKYAEQLSDVCDDVCCKIYKIRNNQDELPHDVYTELHKWAFDSIGYIVFSKKMGIVEADMITNHSDSTWLYNALENATNALMKCESGLQLWKLFDTPSWLTLVDSCSSLESFIGKQVHCAEQEIAMSREHNDGSTSLISAILLGDDMKVEDTVTILMDMLIIGVNTTTSAMSFLLYNLARSQRSQRLLHKEIVNALPNIDFKDLISVKQNTPYLQACIKETLRLIPPIPILTRILPKNIVLDKFKIPRGTLMIMSTKDSSLKESNFEDAQKFYPDRWLKPDAKEYHAFASIPFGFGARKCLGQGIAEACISMLTIKLIEKFKLEYHYGEIEPTSSFIARPNKQLKLRFIDRD